MRSIWKIIVFTKEYTKLYSIMGVFVVTVSLLSLVIPILSKYVVDIIVAQLTGAPVNFQAFYLLLALILCTDLGISTLTAIGQWIGDILAVRLQTLLSQRFYKHVLSLHIGYYDNEITGKIVNKMYRGITSITDFIQNMLNNFLPFFLTAFVTILLLAQYSLFISVLLAILFPLYIVISHSSSTSWMKYEQEKNKIADVSQGRVFESIVGIRIVKSFAAEITELTSFLKARKEIEGLTIQQTKQWHLYDFVRRVMLNLILFGIYAYVVYWTFQERYTLGEMTLLLQLVQQARFPLFAMSFILGQIQQASAGSKDYFQIIETKSAIVDKPHAKQLTFPTHLQNGKPIITFSDISFSYESNKNILKHINFSIYKGEKFALVGESGQGKSTIINLLLRYYEPQEGSIQLANQDIAQVTQTSLRDNIAVVFQESLLFSGTIKENIAFGKIKATNEEIIEAAKAANAHDFVLNLEKGYDSIIGERGVKLSGGQKQRIAIARAIIKNAPIIILDEATSSLDSKAELEVQKGLQSLLKGKTSIIIAHRLSTIANADHILVVENGEIAQYGSHIELLKDKKGLYAQLVHLQQQMLKSTYETQNEKLKAFDLIG
jgi:ATP-binding cassette subfamily B protein